MSIEALVGGVEEGKWGKWKKNNPRQVNKEVCCEQKQKNVQSDEKESRINGRFFFF